MILCCEQLTYLDTRPVSENDRVCIEAWRDGGAEAERALRQKIANEKHAKMEEDIRKLAKYIWRTLCKIYIKPYFGDAKICNG